MTIFKRFKLLEWLWLAHAGLGLALLVLSNLFGGGSTIFSLFAGCLAAPLLLLLRSIPDCRLLLDSFAVRDSFILYGILLLNGGGFYLIARVFFQKQIMEVVQRFKFLEWLWFAHALLGAMLHLGGSLAGGLNILGLAAALFLVPLGFFVPDWTSVLSETAQLIIMGVTLILNGGLFYLILRVCFRRKRVVADGVASAPAE